MAKQAEQASKKPVPDSRPTDAAAAVDISKLSDAFQKKALFWRSLALVEIPVTLFALLFAVLMWIRHETFLNVQFKPAPGYLQASKVPAEEFLSFATDWVNLVATYQRKVAGQQFEEAAKMLVEPALSKFRTEMLGPELRVIQNTARSQAFYADPGATQLERDPQGNVVVTMMGTRTKRASDQDLPDAGMMYRVVMNTQDDTKLNPYGIVVVDYDSQ